MRQRACIDIFQFATDRDTARDTRHAYPPGTQHRGDVVRGCLALVGVIGRQDDLLDDAVEGTRQQALQPQLAGAYPVKRRYPPHQDVIEPLVAEGLLHHVHVDRGLHDAQQRRISPRRGATLAQLALGKGIAALTMANRLQRMEHGLTQPLGTGAVPLQQMIGQALRRFRPDAGQAAQRLDQGLQP